MAYPNRNSLPFQDFYGVPEAETVIRDSLRYEGNPAFVKALIDLRWLDTEPKDWLVSGLTWAQVMQKAIGSSDSSERWSLKSLPPVSFLVVSLNCDLLSSLISRIKELCQFPSTADENRIVDGLRWIGLFSCVQATVCGGNLLDTLCAQLEIELSYRPGERNLVMLQHKFVVE